MQQNEEIWLPILRLQLYLPDHGIGPHRRDQTYSLPAHVGSDEQYRFMHHVIATLSFAH
jgi:hypothetical protein